MCVGKSCSCPSLSGGYNYTLRVTGTKCGDIAIFECSMGWFMMEGGQQRTAVCLYGNWTVTTVQCIGMNTKKVPVLIQVYNIYVLFERSHCSFSYFHEFVLRSVRLD
jgi:hypothetical protein